MKKNPPGRPAGPAGSLGTRKQRGPAGEVV